MKATGIVRRIDDLGRVVIPKEIRRTLRIREGDPLEIFVDREGEVILKKYSPIGELGDFAKEYADSLHESLGHIACIADRDVIIAVSGASRKDYINQAVSSELGLIMEKGETVLQNIQEDSEINILKDADRDFSSQVIAPIWLNNEAIGAVLLLSPNPEVKMGAMEVKLAETAASFLAKQMEA
ncbi:MAG: stage V sporulation protein T [Clostridia bacterium]|nr:stage V sporulation protein T [Clostridia bacterium]